MAVYSLVKRAIDLGVALAALSAVWPLMVAIAIAVRLDSEGPALYAHRRIGRHGRLFTMYKFRTMRREAAGVHVETDAHPAITRIGRVLRHTSLDELPQLFNVLRGDMSLVGPRPAMHDQCETLEPAACARLSVRPGITGLAQVGGRNALSWEQRLRLDLHYVEHPSLGLDMQILLRTLVVIWRRDGIYTERASASR